MNQQLIALDQQKSEMPQKNLRFFTETVEVGRILPMSFYEAGSSLYDNERFYWQNADQSMTLVGIGHAHILYNESEENRFQSISTQWESLSQSLIKEEKDVNPILFGGFSFDPLNKVSSEWNEFPEAYFIVPTFQFMIRNGKTTISINLLTIEEDAVEQFEELRIRLEQLIHLAQVNELVPYVKPNVLSVEERNKELYIKAVRTVTDKINEGIADKVVLARSIKINFEESVEGVCALHHIATEQQESYHFGLQKDQKLFFGATPERLIEVKAGQAISACVAGSIPRGKSAEEDRSLGETLLADDKNLKEHDYVVQMIFDVFEKYCSSIDMPKGPKLMKVRDIQHLFTPIEGPLKRGVDIFTLVESLHPTPALGGVPTSTSLEMIRQYEQMNRGYYAAPVGWTDTEGDGEFAVAIRSALLNKDEAYLYAGGGIVADSDAQTEYDETWVKFRPVMRSLGGNLNG